MWTSLSFLEVKHLRGNLKNSRRFLSKLLRDTQLWALRYMRDRGCGRQALNYNIFKAFNHSNACLWLVLTRGHYRTYATREHCSDWYWLGITTKRMRPGDTVMTGIDWGALLNGCSWGTVWRKWSRKSLPKSVLSNPALALQCQTTFSSWSLYPLTSRLYNHSCHQPQTTLNCRKENAFY